MGILFPMGMGMDIVSFGNGMGISTREWEGIDAKKQFCRHLQCAVVLLTTGQALNCAVIYSEPSLEYVM